MSVQDHAIPVLTIDGPSGAGKGTVSAHVAAHLGWHLLDSGALYRAVACQAQLSALDVDDSAAMTRVAETLDVRFVADTQARGALTRVYLGDTDISDLLRKESTGARASIVAAYTGVRHALLQKQRDMRRMPGLVADGRDMGTVVFADAPYKVFLTASAEERAKRRYKQLKAKDVGIKMADLVADIRTRDERDRTRKEAPLVAAADAVVIDTTEMHIEAVVNEVLQYVQHV